jgi:pimeloyl-ACP methyl ester carboxylesterase
MKLDQLFGKELRHFLALLPAVFLALVTTAAVADNRDHDDDSDRGKAPLVIKKQGNFFVGGHYNEEDEFVGQMYVEYQIPKHHTHRYPLVFIHGGGQIGSGWWTTPDGREGWAQYFLRQGFAVYVVDVPARGRSAYNSDLGPLNDPNGALRAQQLWAASERFNLWPAASLHTQWVGPAVKGDRTFDQFMRSQSDALQLAQEDLSTEALVALLDRIGPAILVPHSQPGMAVFRVADRRPNKAKALLQLEPGGPPVFGFAPLVPTPGVEIPWGLTFGPITYSPAVSDPSELSFVQVPITDPYVESCWVQAEPARQLPNLQRVPILLLTSESGYNTLWDPCTSKYLTQAGVEHTWLRLEEIGIRGNGHFYFIEKNSDEVAGVVLDWIEEHVE